MGHDDTEKEGEIKVDDADDIIEHSIDTNEGGGNYTEAWNHVNIDEPPHPDDWITEGSDEDRDGLIVLPGEVLVPSRPRPQI